MKQFAAPFKQLIERRLWPVAILLVAALVAVPKLLASQEPTPAVATTATTTGSSTATDAIVSVADPARTDTERRVLGSRKDPFRPAIKAKPVKTPKASSSSASDGTPSTTAASGGAASGDTAGGSAGAGTTTAPSTGTTTTPAAPKPVYELYSLSVRFGPSTGPLADKVLKRLKGLPGGARPAVLYLGLKADHKTAVFMVDATAKVEGDGHCDPSPEDCQTLTLKTGETEFVNTADGKQYELDLVQVHTSKTTDQAAVQTARSAESAGGRRYLRRHLDRVGGYHFSATTGLLSKVSRQAATAASASK